MEKLTSGHDERIAALESAVALLTNSAKIRVRNMTAEEILALANDHLAKLQTALGLAKSMIACGEKMTPTSIAVFEAADMGRLTAPK